MNATDIIQNLGLLPHPEGGHYKETYRSKETCTTASGERSISTSIYYLLEEKDFSAFHRVRSDEHWFFHQGESIELLYFKEGMLHSIYLGNNIAEGEVPQAFIEANLWFAARIRSRSHFALVSCTVAPGFDFRDFELAAGAQLLQEFPRYGDTIRSLTQA